MRFLLVDDEPKILDAIERSLSLDDHEVYRAQNYQEALEILKKHLFLAPLLSFFLFLTFIWQGGDDISSLPEGLLIYYPKRLSAC